MKISKFKIFLALFVLLTLMLGYGCGNIYRTKYHFSKSWDNSAANSHVKPSQISLWWLGFYNNEVLDGFEPEQIDYSSMIDLEFVDRRLTEIFDQAHQIELIAPPEWAFEDNMEHEAQQDQMHKQLTTLLNLMNRVIKTNRYPSDYNGISWIDIREDNSKSNNTDSFKVSCVVVGLETITKRTKQGNYLRSDVGIILFHEDGQYLGMGVSEYDFTQFTSQAFAGQVWITIEDILGLPRGVDIIKSKRK